MGHDRDRWQRVYHLFHAALARQESERCAFLDGECAGDLLLRTEIESLLSSERSPDSFLDSPTDAPPTSAAAAQQPDRIAHYRILSKLGEGGMGIVYVAEDQRLGRRVALKVLRSDSADPNGRNRLVREARVAAGVTDPLICQVFELGEWDGKPFIVMELLSGEPLTQKLAAGPLPPSEALQIAISIADALCVLHRSGIVHRDLKPSNIFVTPGSVKVLDFGLARPLDTSETSQATAVTQVDSFVGTPQYAAPEVLLGSSVDPRADLFSAGIILYEMLTGRSPFPGKTFAAIVHSVLYDTPPVVTGTPAIAVVDRILHRMLAKLPEDRYSTADSLAADLRGALPSVKNETVVEARPVLRLAVLPFRLLKPDREIEYLVVSLADALVSSLSGLESLVVRSMLKSARYAHTLPDLSAVAADLAVDVVLTGSILRINESLRISAELVSVPAGDVWWTQTTQAPIDQVFELHDQLTQRVITSLPLTVRDQSHRRPMRPKNNKAFDLYLHGMQLRMEPSSWRQARSLLDQCLQLDPEFAPAWAELGRLDRLFGKYEDPAYLSRAESAFVHALELDPENGAAQHHYAQLEIDLGRVEAALSRLLNRVRERRAEPHIYAAMVHACRYGGLLDESVAAHHQARRLDPAVSTSVLHTYYMQGDYGRALEEGHRSSDPFEARVLGALGREQDAIAAARREEERFAAFPLLRSFSTGLRAAFEGDSSEALAALQPFDSPAFNDGEGLFYVAAIYARLSLADRALEMLKRAAGAGFVCLPAFERDPYLGPARASTSWQELLDAVRSRHRSVVEEFNRANGPSLITC
jgi:eukaryotic-like serine/threonine-protein kinase